MKMMVDVQLTGKVEVGVVVKETPGGAWVRLQDGNVVHRKHSHLRNWRTYEQEVERQQFAVGVSADTSPQR